MEKPLGFMELKVFRLNKSLNIWEEAEIIIDFNQLFIEWLENWEITIKRKTHEVTRVKLNTGKIIYPVYKLSEFKEMYYSTIIELTNANVEPLSSN